MLLACSPFLAGTRRGYARLEDIELAISPWRCSSLPGAARLYTPDASVDVVWCTGEGCVLRHDAATRRSEIGALKPGAYAVTVTAPATRAQATMRFRIECEDLPVIAEYDVHDASAETAWDGAVHARVSGATAAVRYQWSTGALTSEPSLRDLPPGTYTCRLVDARGEQVPHVHATQAAQVSFDGAPWSALD